MTLHQLHMRHINHLMKRLHDKNGLISVPWHQRHLHHLNHIGVPFVPPDNPPLFHEPEFLEMTDFPDLIWRLYLFLELPMALPDLAIQAFLHEGSTIVTPANPWLLPGYVFFSETGPE